MNLLANTLRIRYFVAENVLDEVILGWPRQRGGNQLKELLALRLQKAINSVSIVFELIDSFPFYLQSHLFLHSMPFCVSS